MNVLETNEKIEKEKSRFKEELNEILELNKCNTHNLKTQWIDSVVEWKQQKRESLN